MKNFQAQLSRLEGADTQVLGVSIDSPFANRKWASEINVTFPLLSDMLHQTIEAYGIATEHDIRGVKVITARRVNYLIDKQGKVVEMTVDSAAIDPTQIVNACERRKLKE